MEERILEFVISAEEAGQTIRSFLMQRLSFSAHQLSRLKYRERGITVDGAQKYVSHVLAEGECLRVRLTQLQEVRDTVGSRPPKIWLAPPAWMDAYPLRILYEDADLLIADKPQGIVCHPSPGHYMDTLANQAVAYLGGTGSRMDIRIAGRLDRETSGIVTFAKNAEAAAQLQKQRAAGTMEKIYLALAEGDIAQDGTVDAPIRREAPGSRYMVTAPDGRPAVTHYRVLERRGDATLLACTITHGRTHQIRVHMASTGPPLLWDPMYGSGALRTDAERTAAEHSEAIMDPAAQEHPLLGLHAFRLRMVQPFTGETITAEAPAPSWAQLSDDRHIVG